MSTYLDLRRQADELYKQADKALEVARTECLANILVSIYEFGFTAFDCGFITHNEVSKHASRPKKMKTTRAPKYQDPITGLTWTGAGHQPKWIIKAKETYLIARDGNG
jgi:DNA-binding protein H-NS